MALCKSMPSPLSSGLLRVAQAGMMARVPEQAQWGEGKDKVLRVSTHSGSLALTPCVWPECGPQTHSMESRCHRKAESTESHYLTNLPGGPSAARREQKRLSWV